MLRSKVVSIDELESGETFEYIGDLYYATDFYDFKLTDSETEVIERLCVNIQTRRYRFIGSKVKVTLMKEG